MPTYEYFCQCGNHFEITNKIKDMRREEYCPLCNKLSKLQVSGGATFGDEPVWLDDDCRGAFQKPGDRPVMNRGEYKRYLADNGMVER